MTALEAEEQHGPSITRITLSINGAV